MAADGRLLTERTITEGMRHGRELLPNIARATSQVGWRPGEIDLLALSIGPGSFTGLRISVMFARTLASQLPVRIVAVPTLAAIAAGAPADQRDIAVLTYAQKDGLYRARYRRNDSGALQCTESETVGPADEAAVELPGNVYLIGDGLGRAGQVFAGRPQAGQSLWLPRATKVAELGWQLHLQGRYTPPEELEPLYVRRPAPEEAAERRKRGGR